MSNGITLAGTIVSISDDIPATYDAAGFAAVGVVFTVVGEVSNLGDTGRTYEDVSYNTLGERGTVHLKGTYDEPETTFEMIADRADAGQVIVKAASESDENYSFKVEYQNGDVDYFQGKVFSFVTAGGEANTVRTVSANIRIDRRGVVEVLAP